MSCNRCGNINRTGQVMGEFGIPSIALRGPGCISGTGRCDGVLGTGGVSCDELLNVFCRRCGNNVGGAGGGSCGNNVGGAGGSCRSNLLGTGGSRCVNYSDNVQGTGGRNRCCRCSCEDLCTPTIVPR
jgi:hypothetical protein